MSSSFQPTRRSWIKKFRDASVGVFHGIRGQSSFAVHLPCALLVTILAAVMNLPLVQWGLLILSITIVLAAEMFNSALEMLARAIDDQFNQRLEVGLNISSGAVLITAIGAVVLGLVVFGARLGTLAGWW